MRGNKIFTKSFFDMSAIDQVLVVDAIIRDIDAQNWVTKEDCRKAIRRRREIINKAVKYGVMK